MELQPCYKFSKPNDDVCLGKIIISVPDGNSNQQVEVDVVLRLVPEAGIYFHGLFPRPGIQKLNISGKDVEGFAVRESMADNGQVDTLWTPRKEEIISRGDDATKLNLIIFHLFNYPNFIGIRQTLESIGNSIYHLDLNADGWCVEIKSLPNTNDNLKMLQETGGYGLTHVGCMKQKDGSVFDAKTAKDMLSALHSFLSFSVGMQCHPCLAVGFDGNDNRVWEVWDCPRERSKTSITWFDRNHPEQLTGLFPGFMSKWSELSLREAMEDVIDWYMKGNQYERGIEAAVILSQSGIEKLSFVYVVTEKKLKTEEEYKKLRASDRFRLLFSSLGIPIDVPVPLIKLKAIAAGVNGGDGPYALTYVRNAMTHSKSKCNIQFDECFEAWKLGQWYLELALLAICGYSGTYANRLDHSKWASDSIENVPWDNNKGKVTAPTHT